MDGASKPTKKRQTSFPMSRIKKMMQQDEDVGKISLHVPIMLSRALELFLAELAEKTYESAVAKGAKSIGPHHLKDSIMNNKNWDFLQSTVAHVTEVETAKRRGPKQKKEDDDDGDDDEAEKKVKRSPAKKGGRPKKTAAAESAPAASSDSMDVVSSVDTGGVVFASSDAIPPMQIPAFALPTNISISLDAAAAPTATLNTKIDDDVDYDAF